MSGPTVYQFGPQLEYSATLSDEPSWEAFYRRIWPDMIGSFRVDGANRWQRDGVDRIVYLPNRKEIRIDEKKRAKDYGDIALEDWSVFYRQGDPRNKVGWALDRDKVCDFVTYAIVPTQRCYLLPFEILRLSFEANYAEWVSKYRMSPTHNVGYQTLNVGVRWSVLYPAMVRQMLRSFGVGQMNLPKPEEPTPLQGELQLPEPPEPEPVMVTATDIRWG